MTVRRAFFVSIAAVAVAVSAGSAAVSSTGQQSPASPSSEAAIAKLRETIASHRSAGDLGAAADAQITLAEAYQAKSDTRRSLESYEEAIALYRAAGNTAGEARALSGMASSSGRLSDYQKSMELYSQALPLFRGVGDRRGEAAALTGIGMTRVRLNQYAEARAIFDEALPIYQALNDRRGEATVLQQIGIVNFSQDQYTAAIDAHTRALSIAREVGARALEATIRFNIAQVYYHLGDYQKALDLFNEVLAAHRELGNRSGEAIALGSLGRVYNFLREYPKALDHLEQSRPIFRALGERLNEATAINNIAHVHLSLRQYREALPLFEQSLEISRAVGNRAGEASNTNGIGLVYAGLGEYEKALTYHREAQRLFRSLGHKRADADSFGHIGRAYDGLGDYKQARTQLQDALAIYRALGVPRNESETLYAMARSAQRAGDLGIARTDIDMAIRIAEGFRQNVSNPQLRTSYQGTIRDFYELKIDVLMQQHRQGAPVETRAGAFDASERARARGLLDLLAEARADIRGDVDPSLLERERALRQQLAGRAERQTQLAGSNAPSDQIASIGRAIETDLSEYERVLEQLRARSPRYAALMQPEPLTLTQIQSEVLDDDTVLLEYFLGAERSYAWAVTKAAVIAHQLPARAEIETAARRFYELLGANDTTGALPRAAKALSDLVLAPLAHGIRQKRVAIVADGALHYVPFAALPDPRVPPTSGREQPLIVNHEIVSLPSASTLSVLRREAAGRTPQSRLVAVLADPVFDAGDVRVRRKATASTNSANEASASQAVRRSFEDVATGQPQWPLPRLLGTRREARSILSLAPAARRREALDFDASRETATSGDLAGYQVVHFATHALINNEHPELSGLVLSLVDNDGRARDGFLRLNDIYNLRLPADLVVLSACRTGLGKEMRGEGLIGLTRGFMYAGAPRVLTSLWQVDDAGTSELMARFYRSLLADRQLNAAAALRAAQIEMWRQRDWQSPYYWAAFTVQGEWQSAPAAGTSR